MAADWTALCRGARDLRIDGDSVEVRFAQRRHHVLSVEPGDDAWRLQGIVAKPSVAASVPDLPLRVWRRNRASTLVGFRVDARGRLIGESWVPTCGLSATEFQDWVRIVATECDRFEHTLTGKDDE
jgi:hypothetical protein